MNRILAAGIAAAALAPASAGAVNTFPDKHIFTQPTWICAAPEEYATVTGRSAAGGGNTGDLGCYQVGYDDIEDIMAPWVEILEERDGLVKVTFLVERYKRLRPRGWKGGRTTRVLYTGWTDPARLENVTTD